MSSKPKIIEIRQLKKKYHSKTDIDHVSPAITMLLWGYHYSGNEPYFFWILAFYCSFGQSKVNL